MHLQLFILAGIQVSALLACGLAQVVACFEGVGFKEVESLLVGEISFGSTDETSKAAKWLGVGFSIFSR